MVCGIVLSGVLGSQSVVVLHSAGLRSSLTEVGIGQAWFLLTGLPPFVKLRDFRASNRGQLQLSCRNPLVHSMKSGWKQCNAV